MIFVTQEKKTGYQKPITNFTYIIQNKPLHSSYTLNPLKSIKKQNGYLLLTGIQNDIFRLKLVCPILDLVLGPAPWFWIPVFTAIIVLATNGLACLRTERQRVGDPCSEFGGVVPCLFFDEYELIWILYFCYLVCKLGWICCCIAFTIAGLVISHGLVCILFRT